MLHFICLLRVSLPFCHMTGTCWTPDCLPGLARPRRSLGQNALRVTTASLALPNTEWVGDLPTPTEAVTGPMYEEANRRLASEFNTSSGC